MSIWSEWKSVFLAPRLNRMVTIGAGSVAAAFFIAAGANAYLAARYETPTCTAVTPLASPACAQKGDYIFSTFRLTLGGFAVTMGGISLIAFGSLFRRPALRP